MDRMGKVILVMALATFVLGSVIFIYGMTRSSAADILVKSFAGIFICVMGALMVSVVPHE